VCERRGHAEQSARRQSGFRAAGGAREHRRSNQERENQRGPGKSFSYVQPWQVRAQSIALSSAGHRRHRRACPRVGVCSAQQNLLATSKLPSLAASDAPQATVYKETSGSVDRACNGVRRRTQDGTAWRNDAVSSPHSSRLCVSRLPSVRTRSAPPRTRIRPDDRHNLWVPPSDCGDEPNRAPKRGRGFEPHRRRGPPYKGSC